ncbi:Ferric reductase transmembrane component 3 [Pichia kudriavzevii]|uniref:Ferric reductase transmembrane component 3 n=1 Tax=Pichia kudriavzevii TaxID=4909 RepID=A0A1V2LNA0_PICKU|nr:Ferric reductase transmembrane component 3 [Pichia kudriavzevii]
MNIILLLIALTINICFAESKLLGTTLGQVNAGVAEFWGCEIGVRSYVVDFKPPLTSAYSKYHDKPCGYPPLIGTMMVCFTNLTGNTSEKYIEKLSMLTAEKCNEFSSFNYTAEFYKQQYYNATKHLVDYKDVKNLSQPIYSPLTTNVSKYYASFKYYKSYYANVDNSTYFAVGICGYFLALIIIGAIHNFCRETSVAKSINGTRIVKLFQRYIVFPTLLPGGKYYEAYGWKYFTILSPNRAQFLVDFVLMLLQIGFYGATYYHATHKNYLRFLADKTGIMSFGKIPLLILFAGRNNFLLWITGWSYNTFLHFHKTLSYWMILDAVIHSISWTILELGYYVESLKELYFACGVAATVIGCVMIGQSLHPLRCISYEVFLIGHIVLAIGFIAMCWNHCNILGWMEWLVAACCVWFFDRLVRVIRMCCFGIRTAKISVVGKDLIKVEVNKPTWVRHSPGHYYYVYFAGWNMWQNHPFTTVQEGDKLCTYIRVKKGLTQRVFETVSANGGKMEWKVCYEGPYGGNGSYMMKKYDDSLLIAGGSGVPGILDEASRTSEGKMVWIAQTLDSVKAYEMMLRNVKLDLELYITREQGSEKTMRLKELWGEAESEDTSSTDDKSNSATELEIKSCGQQVHAYYGKPNVAEIVDKYVRESPSSNVGIIACGPPKMMDELSHTMSLNVTKWDKSVDYYSEFQIW